MRIAFLTQYYPPEVGAPQARLSELARAFVRRGHAVEVLTAQPNYPTGACFPGYEGWFRRELLDGVDVMRTAILPSQSRRALARIASYFSFVTSSALAGAAALQRPDYLLVESPPLFLGLSGLWLKLLKRTRLIFNVSDLWPDGAVRLGFVREGSLVHRGAQLLERECYRAAWLVTGQSRTIVRDIATRFPEVPTFHLSNGCDTNKYGPSRRTAEARQLIDPEGGKQVFVYAGLHGLAQGLDQVLEIADRARADDRLRFVLIGDGPDKRRLIAEANRRRLGNVRFFDIMPSESLPPVLAAADGILVTLKLDLPGAVPSKIYEAMASARPIVLVATGEAAEIVRRHEAGVVIEPNDVAGLLRAVRDVAADPARAAATGDRARQAAVTHFDRALIADRFIDHLERHLAPRREPHFDHHLRRRA